MRKNDDLAVRISIFIIIAAGFLLRINHWWDFLGADETGWKGLITWTWGLHKDPFPVHYYPPLFLYINFVLSLLLKKLTLFLGVVDFNTVFQDSGFGFIFTLKTGRLLSAVFGTFNIYMVYRIGREFYNRYAGLCAALLLAVFWPHVIDSHNFKSDVLLTLLITLVVYFTLKFTRHPKSKYIILASFFLGLSIASKFNGAFFGFILLLPLFYLRKEIPVIRNFFYIAAGTAAGFFAGAPNWIVHPLSNVKATLKYLKGLSEEVVWYDPVPTSFFLYGKNFLEHFGVVLLLFLAAAIILSFLKKQRTGVIVSMFFLVYFILAGLQNYLNYRAILPIVPLAVLLMGKLIFYDTGEWIRNKKVWAGVVAVLMVPVLFYSLGNGTRSYKSFDLLKGIASHAVREKKGIGEPDYSSWFIRNHLAGEEKMFREMWTPPGKGVKGVVFARDVTRGPEGMFAGPDGFRFLMTSFRTDYILRKAENIKVKTDALKRLKGFSPFHKVYRPPIFTWSDDIQFWYRRPAYITGGFRPDTGVMLPRTFIPDTGNPSVHLPLQRYEKDPCTGIVRDGAAGKYIFSAKKIDQLDFRFVHRDKLKLTVDINGKSVTRVPAAGSYTSRILCEGFPAGEFSNIAIRRLYETELDEKDRQAKLYIYKVEIRANTRAGIPYSFIPKFSGEKTPKPEKEAAGMKGQNGDIPPLFSGAGAPEWVRKFYRKTGVDLLLLARMNTRALVENPDRSVRNIRTGYLPVRPGHFRIGMVTERLVPNRQPGTEAELRIRYISGNRSSEKVIPLKEGSGGVSVFFGHPGGFIRISSSGVRENNLMIRNISLVPDFARYAE